MNNRVLLTIVLVLFGGLTAVVFWFDGLLGFPKAIVYSYALLQIYVDLVIAVAIICVWLYRNAKARGKACGRGLRRRLWWAVFRRWCIC